MDSTADKNPNPSTGRPSTQTVPIPAALAIEREALSVEREAVAVEREAGGFDFPADAPALEDLLIALQVVVDVGEAIVAALPSAAPRREVVAAICQEATAMADTVRAAMSPEIPTASSAKRSDKGRKRN